MVVRAPFDGVAISKDAQPGEMISPVSAGGGFTRTGICDDRRHVVARDRSRRQRELHQPRACGQPVEAVLDAYPDWRIPAHVITTIPSADRQKATVRCASGSTQLDPRILPDMGVKVSFLETNARPRTAAAAQPRLLVPKAAIRSADGRAVVFVVHDDRVERRAVSVGIDARRSGRKCCPDSARASGSSSTARRR